MQGIAVALNHQRHHRHRQQRQQRELPADLRRHDDQHRAAHHQRIHQRQHALARREDHPVNVVGGAGDQVAGAMAQVEGRMLTAQLAIEIFPQLDGQLIRSAKQQHAPDVAQQVNHYRDKYQHANPHPHPFRGVMFFGDAINHNSHHLRRDQL